MAKTENSKYELIETTGSGVFTSGQLKIRRDRNRVVTITLETSMVHPSASTASSSPGLIPEWARPSVNQVNVYTAASVAGPILQMLQVTVTPDGTIITAYFDTQTGLPTNRDSAGRINLTYNL